MRVILALMGLLGCTLPAKHKMQVISYNDVEYVGEITIGTPAQTFLVLLNTGTTNLWVPDMSCGKQPRPPECESSQCDTGFYMKECPSNV
ncbi:hypothetical protein ANCDUO_01643 [Ancylostoma duodenale]|uniref:Peptidase A1 domain-containing protein n=1 Tax=Ancylostoma duodenale TaxID=51022 RepID=A0A0C2H8P8_9BILA|nr:hypothetical protein ANCDUO_01643 [Ancylostoma duodenale]